MSAATVVGVSGFIRARAATAFVWTRAGSLLLAGAAFGVAAAGFGSLAFAGAALASAVGAVAFVFHVFRIGFLDCVCKIRFGLGSIRG